MSNIIICGSKGYKNHCFNNLIDNNFQLINRNNMLLPGYNYGLKNPNIQCLNGHVFKNVKNCSHEKFIELYVREEIFEYVDKFYRFFHENRNIVNFLYLPDNNTKEMKLFLNKNDIKINFKGVLRVGYGLISYYINNGKYPYIIGFGLIPNESNISKTSNALPTRCHDCEAEKLILINLHNKDIVDATFCAFEDVLIPTINCNIIKPKTQSIVYILKTYGICILKNFYDEKTLNNIIDEYHNIFETQKNSIKTTNEEDCDKDERIFHVENSSEFIKKNFSNNELFNNIAKEYTKRNINKKTLINKVVYEEGKSKNSGGGWHRDNHDCQFKTIMYLSDVTEKNGCFQFITNSSKKYVGYPTPRTVNYNTRFHDKTIEELLEKNTNCKIWDIIGKKGTIAIVDTTNIHRGKIIEEGERYAITEYYI